MLCFLFSALVVLLDQLFKRWITVTMVLYEQKTIIPGILGITYVRNPNAALSIDLGGRWVLAAIMFIMVVVLIAILLRYNDGFWGTLGLAAILGGAVGNLIDRVFQGEVVDMFEFLFVNFAVFNIADIFITLGGITFCVFFIVSSIRHPEKAENKKQRRSGEPSRRRAGAGNPEGIDFDDYDDDDGYSDNKNEFDDDELFLEPKPELKPYVRPMLTTEPAPQPESVNPFLTPLKQKGGSAPSRGAVTSSPVSPPPKTEKSVPPAPAPKEPDELSALLDELVTLEADLESSGELDDYDVDELLREYGFEDE